MRSVALDMESSPFIEYLMNMEKSRNLLENTVEKIQSDNGVDVISMQWYWGPLAKMFNLPIPRNANKNLYMVYPSMSLTRLAPKKARERFIETAVKDGIKKYGEIEVDIGSNHTGVYEKVLFPFCKLFVYGQDKMKQDIDHAKKAGAKKVGAYTLDGVNMKNLGSWLSYMTA